MRLLTHDTVQRVWSVEMRPHRPELSCSHCPAPRKEPGTSIGRSAALLHLARHARNGALPIHLRTCQCRERGCTWHRRHRGCHGPVRLVLTGDRGGARWRLADVCTACAALTPHTAIVPENACVSPARPLSRPRTASAQHVAPGHAEARARVREMLAYLATTLPRFCSPGARLLALQCALRANRNGEARLPYGLLRGLHVHQRTELWGELEYTGWLRRSEHPGLVRVRLLEAAVQDFPSRHQRARAAHWAMRPLPQPLPHTLPGSVHLTALALAAHTHSDGAGLLAMSVLTHLCGQTPEQLGDLLDRMTSSQLLTSWQQARPEDDVIWHLPESG
ncbi:hypothetical protein ACIRO1_34405 [Streptomyces sp. NPDC102381]|uniref:hypothetical protein n=1 Tax=Streptomyces sp. NPDC102381 TaxID=3366164 RepID=UPI0037F33B1F